MGFSTVGGCTVVGKRSTSGAGLGKGRGIPPVMADEPPCPAASWLAGGRSPYSPALSGKLCNRRATLSSNPNVLWPSSFFFCGTEVSKMNAFYHCPTVKPKCMHTFNISHSLFTIVYKMVIKYDKNSESNHYSAVKIKYTIR